MCIRDRGKTFVAALPSYLVALSGKGVHVVTVNDYLAKRDGEMIGRVHRFLAVSYTHLDVYKRQGIYFLRIIWSSST